MNEQIEELVTYIQERCLWQFHSRSWDREENIEAILTKTGEILVELPSVVETDAEKCWFADARILAATFKQQYPWIKSLNAEAIKVLFDGVKARMREITVEKSRNEELHQPNY
ncbi:MAG TPA: Fe-only/vanadium nitrogenase subunit delta [Fibrobacteraceae bacterium]|nr:Fe-only/vanadium nitrogenase subunit delta [Fibrobacteraceae bacterium]